MLRCSLAATQAGLPLAGSAPRASTWLVVEQRIPFAAQALSSERLDPRLRGVLSGFDGSVLLARHDRRATDPERFWCADLRPGGAYVSGQVSTLIDALEAGGLAFDAADSSQPEPTMFVCTNGRRDQCCAIESRLLLDGLQDLDTVWECSHIGGHRYAPTALLLPSGYVYGRLTHSVAREALSAARAGQVSTAGARGCTRLAPAHQAADIAVRQILGDLGPHSLVCTTVAEDDATATVSVGHFDGRVWTADLSVRESPPIAESCGKEPMNLRFWSVDSVVESQ